MQIAQYAYIVSHYGGICMENSKFEAQSSKQNSNGKAQIPKRYDLAERTIKFAKEVSIFASKIAKTMSNIEYLKQLIRSSSSVGANYIEANEALSSKDFYFRIKISRKEAKESHYWLQLIQAGRQDTENERLRLKQEALELTKIFGSISRK